MGKATIVLPCLNPDEKMILLVDELIKFGFEDIVIVNDGSDKNHLEPFEYCRKLVECTVLVHEINKGKGRALKTAFEYIRENRPESFGVITVDGDGQHLPADIEKCSIELSLKRDEVIIGARDFSSPHVPFRSKFGNKFTSMVFKVLCGLEITDTQTGLRGIPYTRLSEFIKIDGDRFEYETNMLLHIIEKKVPIKEVKISTVYIEENKTSHFNPILDSFKIYHAILKFSLSSAASSGLDIALFTLLNIVLSNFIPLKVNRILVATVISRLISAVFNYQVNRKAVFKNNAPKRFTFLKYSILCLIQMMASYAIVLSISNFMNAGPLAESIIKIVADTFLFFISFGIQRDWVFKNIKGDKHEKN